MATPLKGKSHKDNPPYPPLTGGYEKANPSKKDQLPLKGPVEKAP